ncbi:MAG: YwmB family TATA-box binding protein [Clostridiales bacterium]|nr:YwmB family TATA-box binding protein [Clostridiales bacterium]
MYCVIQSIERVVGEMVFRKALLITITTCLIILPISVHGWAVFDGGGLKPWYDLNRISNEGKVVSMDDMMAFVGFQREYLDVNAWARLGEDYASVQDLELLADRASKFFGIEGDYDHISSQGEGIIQVTVRGVNENKQVVSITCYSVDTSCDNNRKLESYMVINIVDRIQRIDVSEAKHSVEVFFDTIGLNAKITTTLVGSSKGKLSLKEMEGICNELFSHIRADRTEGITDGEFISISGYSPLFDECITSNGKSVNIQVAMRYNSYMDRTYLWIGVPIINIEC